MKKTLSSFSFVLALAAALVAPAYGQTALNQTTLSSAVTSTSTTTVVVASTTGIAANTTVIFVDEEAMFVNAVSAVGTTLSVTRGYNGTQATTHGSSAIVWAGPPFAFVYQAPSGSCTRGNVLYLPVISFGIGGVQPQISDCVGGFWVTGFLAAQSNTPLVILSANSGGTAYTSLNTNGTTVVAGTLYCAELDVPASKNLTGLAVMFGTTAGGSDKHLVALLDSAGNVLATSALAGATNSTASTYVKFAFTSKYYVVGPGQYYGCTQSNGTSDTIRMLVTGTQDTYLTTSKTGTFGTIPTITVPTGFTTAVGPYMYAY